MRSEVVRTFESIESALEFMVLLEDVIAEASDEAMLEQSTTERYSNGLNLALYKVHQLSLHVQRSRRILNDLTLVSRVLVSDSTAREDESAARDTSGIPSTLPPFSV
jgi:hypothetical protein